MIIITCKTCGTLFSISDSLYEIRKEDGRTFTCPNGHELHYSPSENDKLRAEVKELKANLSRRQTTLTYWREASEYTSRSLAATKGVVTKLKKKLYPERYEK
jgi:hypothetical protein